MKMLTSSVMRAQYLHKNLIILINGREYKIQDVWHFYLSHHDPSDTTAGLEHFVRLTLTSNGGGKIHRDYHPDLDILCLVPESPTL